jgi:hypothetical protein
MARRESTEQILDQFRETVLAATRAARTGAGGKQNPWLSESLIQGAEILETYTPEERRMRVLLNHSLDTTGFGCQTDYMVGVISALFYAITGKTFVLDKRGGAGYQKGEAIVSLTNPNSHTYHIGEVFIVNVLNGKGYAQYGLKMDGTQGNTHGGVWRRASDEEIDNFFIRLAHRDQVAEYVRERG